MSLFVSQSERLILLNGRPRNILAASATAMRGRDVPMMVDSAASDRVSVLAAMLPSSAMKRRRVAGVTMAAKSAHDAQRTICAEKLAEAK